MATPWSVSAERWERCLADSAAKSMLPRSQALIGGASSVSYSRRWRRLLTIRAVGNLTLDGEVRSKPPTNQGLPRRLRAVKQPIACTASALQADAWASAPTGRDAPGCLERFDATARGT